MLRLISAGILPLTALLLLPFNTAAFDSRLVEELIIKSGIRPQIQQVVSRQVSSSFLYTYHRLSARNLETYIAFIDRSAASIIRSPWRLSATQ